ncbi:MAG: FGGY-family carbohydrate kinase [Sphingobacteriaceae bacterium]
MAMNAVAIYDIGKTNKKVFLFNENYEIIWERSENFNETTDEDGDPCEDLNYLTQWILATWQEIKSFVHIQVKGLNFSTYGASFVYLNEKGKVLTPLYNYLKPYPEALNEQFYAAYGGADAVSLACASPILGSLNSGLQIYRLKAEQPKVFNQIRYCLHLPQYLSFFLSGRTCSDITSIGCHTNLWDFTKHSYHEWVNKEGIDTKLAPIVPASDVVEIEQGIRVGTGLHDSSSAMIPYMLNFKEPFLLLSTGTWNISLNPFNHILLTNQELAADCLCYLTYQGSPVKASRLFSGQEHEDECFSLAHNWQVPNDYYKTVAYNPNWEKESGQSYESQYHSFIQTLVNKQVISTNLILTDSAVKRIFVDGGFSKNEVFMNLLAAAYPEIEIYAAEIPQASALGAALVIHQSWNTKPLPNNLISIKKYS